MTPPSPTNLDVMRLRGAKMIVIQGTSDPVFSVDDTKAWYDGVDANYKGHASDFVRFFRVPGMGHSRNGPATDQFDGDGTGELGGEGPAARPYIIATACGAGNEGGVNTEVPSDWAPNRTRPLCPYPLVARYVSGDKEQASSFKCAK